jgi:hypothetical protein
MVSEKQNKNGSFLFFYHLPPCGEGGMAKG